MEDAASKIQTYQTLFWICLALAVLCAVIAVTLFFVLKIHEVFGYLTGRKAKRQILALEESSAGSGRLMSREKSNMHQMAQGIKEDMGVIDKASPGARVVENAVQTEIRQEVGQGSENTSLLGGGQAASVVFSETVNASGSMTPAPISGMMTDSVIPSQGQASMELDIISPTSSDAEPNYGETAMLNNENTKVGTFVIEKEIILLHAETVI
jgi:hypothetical protein